MSVPATVRPLPPLWDERQLDDLTRQLSQLHGQIARADREAGAARDHGEACKARQRATALRQRRVRTVAVAHSDNLRKAIGLGARLTTFLAEHEDELSPELVDALADALSPLRNAPTPRPEG